MFRGRSLWVQSRAVALRREHAASLSFFLPTGDGRLAVRAGRPGGKVGWGSQEGSGKPGGAALPLSVSPGGLADSAFELQVSELTPVTPGERDVFSLSFLRD